MYIYYDFDEGPGSSIIKNHGTAGSTADLQNGKIFDGDLYSELISTELRVPSPGYWVSFCAYCMFFMYITLCILLYVYYLLYITLCVLLTVYYFMYITSCILLYVYYFMYITLCILLHVYYFMYITLCILLYVY